MGTAGAVLLLAGCGASVAGDAGPVGKAAGEPVFSPCDDIPDEAVRAVGMDPATESRDIMDVHQPGWNICGWNNDTHFLSVLATVYTLDDIRVNDQYIDFTDRRIGERDVIVYRDRTDNGVCDVATASGTGSVMFSISESGGAEAGVDPCTAVIDRAGQLLQYVPK